VPRIFPTQPPAPDSAAKPEKTTDDSEESALHIVTSPIVGTVYLSPSPAAESYVKLGDHVSEGSILCIVEAMKLMNEIPSDIQGEIAHIYVGNATPVEFGQKLFAIRPPTEG
jgi:acetyl-CoA carboxylase biotin carboxyl carrier protein